MMKKTEKRFVVGISYEEHLEKAKEIFENKVLPTLKNNSEELTSPSAVDNEPVLTVAQKAHLNCKSPI